MSLSVLCRFHNWTCSIAFSMLVSPLVFAQSDDSTDLVEASQNPIANLISVPFEHNIDLNVGPEDGTVQTMNLKPVLPTEFERFNLINRFIAPISHQQERVPGEGSEFGLGNLTYQGFLSPRETGKYIWGVGPVLTLPTRTDERLGADKWSAGPGAVILSISGPWVVGALVTHSWSFAGDNDENNVNASSLQYFINYNFGNDWYLTSNPTMSADWSTRSSDRYKIPVGGGIGHLVRFREQPVDFRLRGFYNVEKPDGAATWTVQFEVKLLFPKRK